MVVKVISPIPYKAGYTFADWYREKAWINQWDFETDITPKKQYNENGDYLFKETFLYAKWIIGE